MLIGEDSDRFSELLLKEQELAEVKEDMEQSKKMCNFYMLEYRKQKQELAELKADFSTCREELTKAHKSLWELQELVRELKDFYPDNARIADVISRLMQAVTPVSDDRKEDG